MCEVRCNPLLSPRVSAGCQSLALGTTDCRPVAVLVVQNALALVLRPVGGSLLAGTLPSAQRILVLSAKGDQRLLTGGDEVEREVHGVSV